jgi:hypothetical protein
MQSKIIALLAAEGNREATLLVRRGDGQLAARYAPAPAYRAAQETGAER